MKIVLLWATLLVLVGLAQVRADVYVHFRGATKEENEQLHGIYRTRKQGKLARLQFCDSVIQKYPHNRQARLLSAVCLLHMGRVDESERELAYLTTNHPDFPGTLDALAALSLAQGDKERACTFYRQSLKAPSIDNIEVALGQSAMRWYEARILELEGAVDEAEEAWRKISLDETPPKSYLAQFYLRQGRPSSAVKVFESANNQLEGTSWRSVDAVAFHRMQLAEAQWAAGRRSETLGNSLETAQLLLNQEDCNQRFLAHVILTARVLVHRGVGTQSERERSGALWGQALATLSTTDVYSVEAIPKWLNSTDHLSKNATGVAAVLKAAPYLDWALWAALYQGFVDPASSHLLDLLAPDTIQGRIAAVEQKAATN